LKLPAAFPIPAIPSNNPFAVGKAELGRYLFYDRRLSGNGTYSCSSCHQQRLAFTDGRSQAVGATGGVHPMSAMSLTNVAYNAGFSWNNPSIRTLEAQALIPMYNEDPVELGLAGRDQEILDRFRSDPAYRKMFRAAYPRSEDPFTIVNITRSIATFERTLISGNSSYDRYVYQSDHDALDTTARQGMGLFFSKDLGCSRCHSSFNFSGPVTWFEQPAEQILFHNTGLYRLKPKPRPQLHSGLMAHTGKRSHLGQFRAPTLRNIELTAPYMHDGSVATLEEVIEHYNVGGRAFAGKSRRNLGGGSRFKSRLVRPQSLSADQKRALVAFLKSLTDWEFIEDPRFADPFDQGRG
jgi:cytochrome c peroxidase